MDIVRMSRENGLKFDPYADNNVNLRAYHVKRKTPDCMLLFVTDLESQFQCKIAHLF